MGSFGGKLDYEVAGSHAMKKQLLYRLVENPGGPTDPRGPYLAEPISPIDADEFFESIGTIAQGSITPGQPGSMLQLLRSISASVGGGPNGVGALAAADDMSNPTAGWGLAGNMVYDPVAANWNRWKSGYSTDQMTAISADGIPFVYLAAYNGTPGSVKPLHTTQGGGDTSVAGQLAVGLWLYNGISWDRKRNNLSGTLLASAARTATASSADQTNYNHRDLTIIVNVTSITSTPLLTVTIEGKDSISGSYYTILTSQQIAATGMTVLRVSPSAAPVSGVVANWQIPRTWRVTVTHADADSATYSVSYELGV